MQPVDSFLSLIPRYDAFILDLWGVIHDGESLYPGVRETLMAMREAKKQVIFLSNAPRRAHKAEKVLHALGIDHLLYDHVLTSGEAVYGHLAEKTAGKRKSDSPLHYFYLGPDKDLDILSGLPYARAGLAQADFLLNVGFFYDHQPMEELANTLKSAALLKKKMLCVNPDKIVVRRSGEVLPCAGMIAEAYERIGGVVQWFGKPHRKVYQLCLSRFQGVKPSRILAVGDSLETDIKGAAGMGIDAALVTGGILKETLHPSGAALDLKALERLVQAERIRPTYVAEAFG